jgi:hypothetical protein
MYGVSKCRFFLLNDRRYGTYIENVFSSYDSYKADKKRKINEKKKLKKSKRAKEEIRVKKTTATLHIHPGEGGRV